MVLFHSISLVILKFVESVNTKLKKNNIQFVPTCL